MKEFYTESDIGGVRVGSNDFSVIIPNGFGDCTTKGVIFDDNEKAPEEAKYFTVIRGNNINIYEYDCGSDNVVTTISGRYGGYYLGKWWRGAVFFEKWRN